MDNHVKGMQWLGREAHIVEPLDLIEHPKGMAERRWIEFQEVVHEMRRIGRED